MTRRAPCCAGTARRTARRRCRAGVTLMELVTTLAILAVVLGLSVPRASAMADRWLARQAREALVEFLYRARMEARLHGSAVVEVESGREARMWVPGEVDTLRWVPGDSTVRLEVAGTRDRARIEFGPSGLGRVASTTLRVRRRTAELEVVVSSYGRIRR